MSFLEEERATRQISPTSLLRDNPAEAGRSLSTPSTRISRRARVAPTCSGRGRHRRDSACLPGSICSHSPAGARLAPQSGELLHGLITLLVSPALLERGLQGPCLAWLHFTYGGSRLWNWANKGPSSQNGLTSSPDLAMAVYNEKTPSCKLLVFVYNLIF